MEEIIISSTITFILTFFVFYILSVKINKHKKGLNFRQSRKNMPEKEKTSNVTNEVRETNICRQDEEVFIKYMTDVSMNAALEEKAFEAFLQPKYELKGETIVGAEALVRWITEGEIFLYPNNFIPFFEKNGFIINLDLYMFEKVCEIIHSWRSAGIKEVAVSINFSRRHLANEGFAEELGKIADSWKVPRSLLEIEVTESIAMENIVQIQRSFTALRRLGFSVALDDFGSGYSSLGFLKNMPIDTVKLDKSFFDRIENQQKFETIIKHILLMAHELDLRVVAEGIETEEQVNLLRHFDCDMVQGFYYAKPMKEALFKEALKKQSKEMEVDYSATYAVL